MCGWKARTLSRLTQIPDCLPACLIPPEEDCVSIKRVLLLFFVWAHKVRYKTTYHGRKWIKNLQQRRPTHKHGCMGRDNLQDALRESWVRCGVGFQDALRCFSVKWLRIMNIPEVLRGTASSSAGKDDWRDSWEMEWAFSTRFSLILFFNWDLLFSPEWLLQSSGREIQLITR